LKNILQTLWVVELGKLQGLPYSDLLAIPACGRKTIAQLHSLLSDEEITTSDRRLASLIPSPAAPDPVHDLHLYIPQEYRGVGLQEVEMPPSVLALLTRLQMNTIGALHGTDLRQVAGEDFSLAVTLWRWSRELQAGSVRTAPESIEEALPVVIAGVDRALRVCSEHDRHLLRAKLVDGQTLDVIGGGLGVTKERVRQKILKAMSRVSSLMDWHTYAAIGTVSRFCEASVCPLSPELVMAVSRRDVNELSAMPELSLAVIDQLETGPPVWHLHRKSIEGKVREYVRETVEEILSNQTEPISAKSLYHEVTSSRTLPAGVSVKSVLRVLRTDFHYMCEFSSAGCLLVRPSMSRTTRVSQILRRIGRPATAEEIIGFSKQAEEDLRINMEKRTLENWLSRNPYDFPMLGPRLFGLRSQMHLSVNEQNQVCADFMDLLRKDDRVVSTRELVRNGSYAWATKATPHELAAIVRADERFRDLGRFCFTTVDSGIEQRAHLKDLIPQILRSAGRPMTVAEITEDLADLRSVASNSVPAILRSVEGVRDLGYGYYCDPQWRGDVAEFLVENVRLVGRVIARHTPPLYFGDLCEDFSVDAASEVGKALWRTIRNMRTVRLSPDQPTPVADAVLLHDSWPIDIYIQSVLEESESPMMLYEIQWGLGDRFGDAMHSLSLDDLRKALMGNDDVVQDSAGRYLIRHDVDRLGIDVVSIVNKCVVVLESTDAVMGASNLLEQLDSSDSLPEFLSLDIVESGLRSDTRVETIGRRLFRRRTEDDEA